MILKRDSLQLGLILGLLCPALGLVIIYFAKYSGGFMDFLDTFIHDNKLITSIGALCLLANAVVFTIYINTHRDKTAKGVFVVTLIYGVGILVLKLFN